MMDMFDFANRMEKKGSNAELAFNQALAGLAFDIVSEIATSTPTHSGRAASNWRTSIGNPDTGYSDNPFANNGAQDSIDHCASALTGYTAGVIHIANNVPYIAELNAGSSHKAPALFVQSGIARATYKFKSIKLNL